MERTTAQRAVLIAYSGDWKSGLGVTERRCRGDTDRYRWKATTVCALDDLRMEALLAQRSGECKARDAAADDQDA